MSNYDLLEGFIDYVDKKEWINYIENYVIPLWKNALILKEFFENLKSEFQNVSLRDIAEEELPLLLGGVVPSREEVVYRSNSLAKFYKDFFGLKLSDLQAWLLGGELAVTLPKVIVEETAFIHFVNYIFNWLDRAVHHQTLVGFSEPKVDYKGLKEDPYKLKELIRDFYQGVLNISVNYNYHTFFLWSIKQIPYKFMKEAYPRIDQVMDFLKIEFGLTQLKWNIPFREGSDLYKDYTIWCWAEYNAESDKGGWCGPKYSRDKSFGGSICALNEIIWYYLREHSTDLEKIMLSYFNVFPHLQEDYISRVKERAHGKVYSSTHYIYYRGISAANDRSRVGEIPMTLMQMIDEISPHLFLGLVKIEYAGDDYIKITTI